MRGIFLVLAAGILWGCFRADRLGGILDFKSGRVITGTGSFQVGDLPEGWRGPKIRKKQLVFEDRSFGGTIVTDALCGPKFDDAPLGLLAKNLFHGLEEARMKPARRFTLDGRAALRLIGFGKLDGFPIGMDVVVFKKNRCLYDLVYFAPQDHFARGQADFEGWFRAIRAP